MQYYRAKKKSYKMLLKTAIPRHVVADVYAVRVTCTLVCIDYIEDHNDDAHIYFYVIEYCQESRQG